MAATPLAASPAGAGIPSGDPEIIADGLISPLSLAVASDGTVYVAQNFAGTLTQVAPGGETSDIYTDPVHSEVGAVSVDGDEVVFATTGETRRHRPTAKLRRITPGGDATTVANLFRHERRHNPDGDRTYGITHLTRACAARLPGQGVRRYKGVVESHPYATAVQGNGTYVADAAGNSILRVGTAHGRIRTIAVLPATRIKVTRKVRRALDLPRCTVGKTFRAEPVPTDVEIGPDGMLYVTSLPGGPEDPSLGANGRVYQVDPQDGSVTNMGGGLTSPVGLAIGPTGTAYISMLFASTILAKPLGGDPASFAAVDFPGDVEYSDGFVYATATDLTNPGDGTVPPAGKVLRWNVSAPSVN